MVKIPHDGYAMWYRTNEEARTGNYSLRSGQSIEDYPREINSRSVMTVASPSSGVLCLYYKVVIDIECYAELSIYNLDTDEEILEAHNQSDWTLLKVPVAAGINTFELSFRSFNYEGATNASAAYIDDLTLDVELAIQGHIIQGQGINIEDKDVLNFAGGGVKLRNLGNKTEIIVPKFIPLTTGDTTNPAIMFDEDGEVILKEVD